MGVAVRMAVLEAVAANLPHQARRSERPGDPPPPRRFIAAHAPQGATLAAEPRAPERTAFLNARLIDPEAETEMRGDLLVEDGEIVDFGLGRAEGGLGEDVDTVDCAGAALAPGLVDMRVFIGEPGERHKESFGSGGEAAVAGGVTSIVTQPDTTPPVDDPALLEFIVQRVHDERADHAMPHVFTMAALTRGLAGEKMTEFEFLLEAGAVALSEGAKVVADALVFRRCLQTAAGLGALVCHAPAEPRLVHGACATEGATATRLGLPAAPAAAESMMLERDLALVALTGARYHAAQISTAASLEALRRARARGLDVSAAVSATHLALSEDAIGGYRTFCKLDPPLRAESDRLAMIEGLASGEIDVVVSSHRPQSEEAKRQPFAEAASGGVGLETLLSATLSAAGEAAPLPKLLRALTAAPAHRLGLPTGRLAAGAPADLVLFDPEARWRVNRHQLRSKSKKLALRPRRDARPRAAHHGRGPHGLRRRTGDGVVQGALGVTPDILGFDRALPYLLGALLSGYVVGGLPFGLIVTRAFGLGDIRNIGSGNIGATNVLRSGNKLAALATLILDVAKGAAPALIAWHYFGPLAAAAAGFGAFLGHCFSPYLGFTGGKGVATGFGVLLAWRWEVGVICAVVWLAAALLSRRSSAGALATRSSERFSNHSVSRACSTPSAGCRASSRSPRCSTHWSPKPPSRRRRILDAVA